MKNVLIKNAKMYVAWYFSFIFFFFLLFFFCSNHYTYADVIFPKYMVADSCHFVFSRRTDATRKDEKTPCEKTKRRKTPCEKTKRRNNAMRKDETRHAKRRNFSVKRRNPLCEKTPFETLILSSFRVASFRLFAWCFFFFFVFSSFRLALFRLVVFSHGVFSSFRGEKSPCEKTK